MRPVFFYFYLFYVLLSPPFLKYLMFTFLSLLCFNFSLPVFLFFFFILSRKSLSFTFTFTHSFNFPFFQSIILKTFSSYAFRPPFSLILPSSLPLPIPILPFFPTAPSQPSILPCLTSLLIPLFSVLLSVFPISSPPVLTPSRETAPPCRVLRPWNNNLRAVCSAFSRLYTNSH